MSLLCHCTLSANFPQSYRTEPQQSITLLIFPGLARKPARSLRGCSPFSTPDQQTCLTICGPARVVTVMHVRSRITGRPAAAGSPEAALVLPRIHRAKNDTRDAPLCCAVAAAGCPSCVRERILLAKRQTCVLVRRLVYGHLLSVRERHLNREPRLQGARAYTSGLGTLADTVCQSTSGGKMWIEWLTDTYNVTSVDLYNFAYAHAATP